MHAYTNLAQKAYAPSNVATHSERDVEYHAFAYVTGLLSSALAGREEPGGFMKLAEAMHENVRLWMTLAADVADDANQLPKQTRAQIIGLANFARTHMTKVMDDAADASALIDVNLAIMRGLRGQTGEESGVA